MPDFRMGGQTFRLRQKKRAGGFRRSGGEEEGSSFTQEVFKGQKKGADLLSHEKKKLFRGREVLGKLWKGGTLLSGKSFVKIQKKGEFSGQATGGGIDPF